MCTPEGGLFKVGLCCVALLPVLHDILIANRIYGCLSINSEICYYLFKCVSWSAGKCIKTVVL